MWPRGQPPASASAERAAEVLQRPRQSRATFDRLFTKPNCSEVGLGAAAAAAEQQGSGGRDAAHYVRCHRCRLRRVRRLGRQAAGRGRHQGGAPRSRQEAGRQQLLRAHEPVRSEVPRQGSRDHPPHAPAPEGLLRVHGIQLPLVRERPGGAVHDTGRQALLLAGPHARRRRAHERVGAPELPLQPAGSERQVVRRIRRGLAALLRRPRAVLRHRRGVRRHLGSGGRRARAARRPVPPAHADVLRGDAVPHAGQGEARSHSDDWPDGEHHEGDQRPAGVPLLRTVRARLRDALLLQRRVHDRCGRREDRQLHAHHRRDGLQGADGHGLRGGDGRALHRPRHAGAERGAREARRAVRAGARVRAHPAQLIDSPVSERPRQLERRPRPLPGGSHCGWPAARAASSRNPGRSCRWPRPGGRPGSTRSGSRTR